MCTNDEFLTGCAIIREIWRLGKSSDDAVAIFNGWVSECEEHCGGNSAFTWELTWRDICDDLREIGKRRSNVDAYTTWVGSNGKTSPPALAARIILTTKRYSCA